MRDEERVQPLIGEIDAQLLERVRFEAFEAKDVEQWWGSDRWAGIERDSRALAAAGRVDVPRAHLGAVLIENLLALERVVARQDGRGHGGRRHAGGERRVGGRG